MAVEKVENSKVIMLPSNEAGWTKSVGVEKFKAPIIYEVKAELKDKEQTWVMFGLLGHE